MAQKQLVVGRFTAGKATRAALAGFAVAGLSVFVLVLAGGGARAQSAAAAAEPEFPYQPPADIGPVPPQVEEAPVAASNGGYCFAGPHPADPRFAPGEAWDDSPGVHVHEYAPLDLRLFAFRNGCYSFIGDPTDFGYHGKTFAYYGAHPILADHGGGWCFMIGGHSHAWRPWSPYFVVAGPWFYWQGPYDRVFWNYWPYYATYYRQQYPTYYRGGRFARGGWDDRGRGGYAVAPPLGGRVHRSGLPGVAGPEPGWTTHFGATAVPSPGWRQPNNPGWGQTTPGGGQTNPGWGQTNPGAGQAMHPSPSPGWGTARPAWGAGRDEPRPRPAQPAAAPVRAPSFVAPSYHPMPVAPSTSNRAFTIPANGSFSRHTGPSAAPGGGFGSFHRR